MNSLETIKKRKEILKTHGYWLQGYWEALKYPDCITVDNNGSPMDYAETSDNKERGFKDWEHQCFKYNGHGWEYTVRTWNDYGIASTWSDEKFDEWIKTIPELENKAREGLEEFTKAAQLEEELEKGINEAENEKQRADEARLNHFINGLSCFIKEQDFEKELESIKYKKAYEDLKNNLFEIIKK